MNEVNNQEYQPMTVGQWVVTFILCAIPIVNIIMIIVWAVSGTTHPSKKTWAKARLLLMAIWMLLGCFLIAPLVWWFLADSSENYYGEDYGEDYYEYKIDPPADDPYDEWYDDYGK